MKLLNFIFAAACFIGASASWFNGFTWQAGMLWCMGSLYIKCGLDMSDDE